MPKLILLRHGQSLWNKEGLFTGWVDVPLSEQGVTEALNAGKTIAEIPIDLIYVSTLMRAQQTAMLAMVHHNSQKTPVLIHDDHSDHSDWTHIYADNTEDTIIPAYSDWRLNERYYGKLQGSNKDAMRKKFGIDQIKIWRRSFDVPPPDGESLKMTAQRTIPCLKERIIPSLDEGKTILVSAHGNSLRSIVMELDGLSKEAVLELEIATGDPIIYEYKEKEFIKLT